MTTCSICTETQVQSVECYACRYTACSTCTKQYILSYNNSAQCMNPPCHAPWSLKFLHSNFDRVWLNGPYRDHFNTLLIKREKSKIPETVSHILRLQKENKNDKLIEDLQGQINDLESQILDVQNNLQIIQAKKKRGLSLAETPRFLCPCPYPDCRGLIEISTFQCGVCNNKICKRCRSPIRPKHTHECNEKDVETLNLLLSDTKPCPKCFSPIYKIEGCNQMWCTKCRTPFSWNTGKKITGLIHNPHAIQWQREHGGLQRDLRDVPCGGLIGMYFLRRLPADNRRQIQKIHCTITEIEDILQTPYVGFDDLRKKFVLNEITEEQWKLDIVAREEDNMQKKTYEKIFQLLQVLAIERFRDLAHNIRGKSSSRKMEWAFNMFILEIEQIRNLINTMFKEEIVGGTKPFNIGKTWKGSW